MSHSINRQWFVPGDGIAREVITADIQRYLGPDATVRPGTGTGEYEGADGFWITAYRTLTTQMIQDLKQDSQRWRAEISHGRVAYQDSRTHQSRQYYGPTTPAPSEYAQPSVPSSGYPASYGGGNYTHQQPPARYPQQTAYVPSPAYGQEAARTEPRYTYSNQAPSNSHYAYGQQPQDPQYAAYAQHAQVQPRQDIYSPPQPSSNSSHYAYAQDGRAYTQQPPQANDSRRRR